MISNIENFRKKLLFRSTHRGTKEMDLLLGGFFKENQNSLSEKDLLEFEKILEFTDKLLSDWLIFEKPNNDLANFLISKKIKDFKIKP
jgi:succinate dehydrogenase flavin-adding protein (antitoxin of CptAB toxin-antitoxin module)